MLLKIRNLYSGVLSLLVMLLGFGGCSDEKSNWVEYGTPYATFKIKGKVVSEETRAPVKGIQVKVKGVVYPLKGEVADVYTDDKGEFIASGSTIGAQEIDLDIIFSDVDGEENGSFSGRTVDLKISEEDYKNKEGRWHVGDAEKEMGDIALKPEK